MATPDQPGIDHDEATLPSAQAGEGSDPPDPETAAPLAAAHADGPPTDDSGADRTPPVRRKPRKRPSASGLTVALLFFALSLRPSLLPLPWLYQGLVTGLCISIGYGIGWVIGHLLRLLPWKPSARATRIGWSLLAIGAIVVLLDSVLIGETIQNDLRTQFETPTIGLVASLLLVVLSLGMAFVFVSIARAVRLLGRWIIRMLDRRMTPGRALWLGGAMTAVAVVVIVVVGAAVLMAVFNSIYGSANADTDTDVTQPAETQRSGSPESLVAWDTLGREGRNFVSRGPSQDQLRAFNGFTPVQPIRAYVGLDSAPDAASRATLAVQELERTGAFKRKVIVVATPTGTGWLEPQSMDPVEFLYNGDTAIVSTQYSYYPSWISFLVDKQKAQDAGRELYNAVHARWLQLPTEGRPKLLVYGLSLGSFGQQAAFPDLAAITKGTDGALFTGTPGFSQPWGQITAERDEGSPMYLPVYRKGTTVRFAATEEQVQADQSVWTPPRVLYAQHANDPVVWWNPDLIWSEPDWLREPRGPGVSPHMSWFPLITFVQVTVDLFVGTSFPNGVGHNYGNMTVSSWIAVSQIINLDPAATDRLQAIIDQMPVE